MLKTLKEFTSVAEAEVESLKLLYASVVCSLWFFMFICKYVIHEFPIFIVLKKLILSYRVEMRMH